MAERKINTNRKRQNSLKALFLNASVLLLLGVLLNAQLVNFTTSLQANKFEKYYKEQLKFSHATADISKSNKDPEHPYSLEIFEKEVIEENEHQDEDINNGGFIPFLENISSLTDIHSFKFVKIILVRSERSFQHRKLIPLFILQQSWKTFLS